MLEGVVCQSLTQVYTRLFSRYHTVKSREDVSAWADSSVKHAQALKSVAGPRSAILLRDPIPLSVGAFNKSATWDHSIVNQYVNMAREELAKVITDSPVGIHT